jgi:hypothetical protein
LIQIPVVRLIPDPNSIPVLLEESLMLSFVKVVQEGIKKGSITSSEINFVPFEDPRNENGFFLGKDLHLRAVDEAHGSELELEIDLCRLIKANGRA